MNTVMPKHICYNCEIEIGDKICSPISKYRIFNLSNNHINNPTTNKQK